MIGALPCQVSVAVSFVPAACVSAATGTSKSEFEAIGPTRVSASRSACATVAPDALCTTTFSASFFVRSTAPTGMTPTPRSGPVDGTATVVD